MTAVAAAISATAEAVASMLIFSVLSLPVVPAAQYSILCGKGLYSRLCTTAFMVRWSLLENYLPKSPPQVPSLGRCSLDIRCPSCFGNRQRQIRWRRGATLQRGHVRR